MKLSEKWLREWINPPLNTTQLSHQLTMAGLEVESITPVGDALKEVVIGQVLDVIKHPDADRLRVCKVIIGENSAPLTIVCGAPNVRTDLKVAVALVGAVLPGDFKIKLAKIRGIESQGMLCSETELNVAEQSEGILELPQDAPIGMPFSEYWHLPDQIMEIKLTPNRADCLSVLGISREIAALNRMSSRASEGSLYAATHNMSAATRRSFVASAPQDDGQSDTLPVRVLSPQSCPRYIGRLVRGINPNAVTPLWMQIRLRRSGIRTIHPIVDIANYVMLELGQPLHAFDLSTIAGEIIVRESRMGEEIQLLDGQVVHFNEPALVIADPEKILALAGIMGGARSGVTAHTTDIFIESAFFTPQAIRPTLQRLLLQSDAAYRYERGVDYTLPIKAMHRITELVLSIAGGQAGEVIDCTAPAYLPQSTPILLRKARIQRLLGVMIPDEQVVEILQNLGMTLSIKEASNPSVTGWEVTPPSYRFDIEIEADLIEELARIYGYDAFVPQSLQAKLKMLPVHEKKLNIHRIRKFLVDKGYFEAINYSFVPPRMISLLDPQATIISLKNPISAEMSAMRTTLCPGLLQALIYNLNRQLTRIRLFETGACFFQQAGEIKQEEKLAAVVVGNCFPEQWGSKNRPLDFFDIKGDLESLLELTGKREDYTFLRSTHPALHSGRSADLVKRGNIIGHIGELHPRIQQALNINLPVYLFEVFLSEILEAELPRYTATSKFPSIRRDLAFIIPEYISYQEIQDKIKDCVKEGLQNVRLFDIYQGQGIQAGQRSVALGLTFQLASRTLIDQEVDDAVARIVAIMKENFQAVLRDT